jgi:3-oxoacyl-[acyl-carrier protein] reductase
VLADWDHAAWIAALEANFLAPVLLIRALLPGMRVRRFGRIVNITSAMVKSPRPHMALSSSARTGLTAFSKAMALDAAADNVTINNLLPERIDTHVRSSWRAHDEVAGHRPRGRGASPTIAAKRFGTPPSSPTPAPSCSAQAGSFRQNLQLDGGPTRAGLA